MLTELEDKKFRKVYRQFKRTPDAHSDINSFCEILDSNFGADNYTVQSTNITTAMSGLEGYSINFESFRLFFPNKSVFLKKQFLVKDLGKIFNEAETILPPYLQMQFLIKTARLIETEKTQAKKAEVAGEALSREFNLDALADLSVELYPKFSALQNSCIQIRETVETYAMGLYRSAISTLIPCIENAIRELGKSLGLDEPENVSAHYLINIIDSSAKKYISDFVYRDFDWVPQEVISKDFFLNFDERVQIMLNCKSYIENHLYMNTTSYEGITNLNRHSVVHGFMSDYHHQANYIRLINLLNGICFMLTFSGENISLFFPSPSNKSKKFLKNLYNLHSIGLYRSKYLDDNFIER